MNPGRVAYELTKRLIIDMPTARAVVDDAIKAAGEPATPLPVLTPHESLAIMTLACQVFIQGGWHRQLNEDQLNRLGKTLVATRVLVQDGIPSCAIPSEGTLEACLRAFDKLGLLAHLQSGQRRTT